MKRVVLIGSTGQLGSCLMKIGRANGFDVRGFSSSELDVTKPEDVKSALTIVKPNIVINTAAFHVVADCDTNPTDAFEVNCVAVRNLALACKECGNMFITYSTDYVFDGKKSKAYYENDMPNPLQMYGISKLAGEYAAVNTHPEGSYVIRTCGVYGGLDGSRSKQGNFVLNIIEEAKTKPSLEVSNEQIVSPTYANDLAQATLELINKDPKPGIYHLVNEGRCSWYEFSKQILEDVIIDTSVKGVDRSGNSGGVSRPVFSALANSKAKKLGIVLPSWQDAVKRYIKELKENERI